MFRYRLHTPDGDDLGEATYPDREVGVRNSSWAVAGAYASSTSAAATSSTSSTPIAALYGYWDSPVAAPCLPEHGSCAADCFRLG